MEHSIKFSSNLEKQLAKSILERYGHNEYEVYDDYKNYFLDMDLNYIDPEDIQYALNILNEGEIEEILMKRLLFIMNKLDISIEDLAKFKEENGGNCD